MKEYKNVLKVIVKRIGRFLSPVVALCLLISLLPVPSAQAINIAEQQDGGNGGIGFMAPIGDADTGAVQVRTAQDLWDIRDNLSGSYVLMNDIDLSSSGYGNFDGQWVPIGDDSAESGSNCFSGVFDGQGFAIKNLSIGTEINSYNGLFTIINGGTVKNVGLEDIKIDVSTTDSNLLAGGICGYSNYNSASVIINCYTTGVISLSSSSTNTPFDSLVAGGICGDNAGTIDYCYNLATISAYSSAFSHSYAGGICGIGGGPVVNSSNMGSITSSSVYSDSNAGGIGGVNYPDNTISNCYNTGNITAYAVFDSDPLQLDPPSASSYSGGICGNNYFDGIIDNCYNAGVISASARTAFYVGAICGINNDDAVISNCYWTAESSSIDNGVGEGEDFTTALALEDMKSTDFVALLNENKGTGAQWFFDFANVNEGYPVFIDYSVITDSTPPALSAGRINSVTTSGASVSFTSDEAGTYYYLVYAAGNTAPDSTTVKAQGTAVALGTSTANASENTVSISGLASATAYSVYVVVADVNENTSVVLTINITTTQNFSPGPVVENNTGGIVVIEESETPLDETVWINPFTDVSKEDWFYADVAYVHHNSLFNGTSSTAFSPKAYMTRGMVVTVLGRLADIDPSDYDGVSFDDVNTDMYYAPYVKWAVDLGIVNGVGGNKFAPESNVSRQDLCLILSNYADKMDIVLRQTMQSVAFVDMDEISEYAVGAVMRMASANIVNGKENGTFAPKASAERSEVAAMLHRFAVESAAQD